MHLLKLIFILLLVNTYAYSQHQHLVANNTNSTKTVVFNKGKSIRLKTADGCKVSGKLFFTQDGNIMVKGRVIAIDEIVKIKKNPFLLSFATGGTAIFVGSTLVTAGLIGALFVADTAALWAIIPGSGLIYAGTKFPNPLRACKVKKGWHFNFQ